MILTPSNSTNPAFWGYEIRYEVKQKPIMPDEFDFFNYWCGLNPVEARKYYKTYL